MFRRGWEWSGGVFVVVVRVSANGCVVRQDFRYMVIKADEAEKCNLLEVLEHALKFLQDGLKHGKVLVHWYHFTTFILFNECTLKDANNSPT